MRRNERTDGVHFAGDDANFDDDYIDDDHHNAATPAHHTDHVDPVQR